MAGAKAFNAADTRHVKNRREQDKQLALHEEDAFRYVMGDVRGRNFVWWLLSLAGLYRDSFTGTSTTDYNCGQRVVGLRLIEQLEAVTPEEFISMWKENLVKRKKAEEADAAVRTEPAEPKEGEEF